MLPVPVFAWRTASRAYVGTVLPPESTARIVTEIGTPAVAGPVIVLNAKWCVPAGMTWIPALVVGEMEPLVKSDAVTVWVPTVFNVTVNWRKPFDMVPEVGETVSAASVFETTRKLSPLGSGFQ